MSYCRRDKGHQREDLHESFIDYDRLSVRNHMQLQELDEISQHKQNKQGLAGRLCQVKAENEQDGANEESNQHQQNEQPFKYQHQQEDKIAKTDHLIKETKKHTWY